MRHQPAPPPTVKEVPYPNYPEGFHEDSLGRVDWDATREARQSGYPGVVHNYHDRSLQEYQELLGDAFDLEALRGKTVLDIGSGRTNLFAREARDQGVKAVSLNSSLRDKSARRSVHLGVELDHRANLEDHEQASPSRLARWLGAKTLPEPEKPPLNSVGGNTAPLPFLDNSFDGIVSVYGVPQYLRERFPYPLNRRTYPEDERERDKAVMTASFNEILRVLKPGAKAVLVDEYADETVENPTSWPYGTEVTEALQDLGSGTFSIDESRNQVSRVSRVITLTKPLDPVK